jgi:hypothetical protein
LVANEALGRPERWTRRRRLGRAGACGNATGRLNRHCQCEFEPATHPAQRPLLPGPPRSPLPAPRSSLLAPRASLLAPRLGRVGRCGRRAARVNWRLQRESESITRRVQRPAPPRPPQGRLVQAGRWSPARSLWVAGLDGESVAQSGWARAIRAVYLRYYALSTAYAAPRWVWIGMGEPYEHERGAM